MRFSSFTYLVGQGWHNMRANRLMTFASMGVLTVCMLLVGAAFLAGINIDAMVDYIGEQNQTIVYLQDGLTEEQTAAVDSAIRAIPGVVGVTYVSPSEVLERYDSELQLDSRTSLAAAFADDIPFDANYIVVVDDLKNLSGILPQLLAIDGVTDLRSPLELSEVFLSLQRAITYAGYGMVAVLALVSIVIINNTIRITVFSRRKEIGIMKLVGATNGFIRFPFFVEGVTSGLLSAAIASGIICGAYYALIRWYADHQNNITQMFGGTLVPLEDVWYILVVAFAAFGFVLCGIGTATSIRKHLNV